MTPAPAQPAPTSKNSMSFVIWKMHHVKFDGVASDFIEARAASTGIGDCGGVPKSGGPWITGAL